MRHARVSPRSFAALARRFAGSGGSHRLGAAALILGLTCAPANAASAAPDAAELQTATVAWDVLDAVVTVDLHRATLAGLGLEATGVRASVSGHALHPLSVAARSAPAFRSQGPIALRATIGPDGFRGFEGGSLYSRGGFRLRGVESLDFSSFELRPAANARDLELVDARGVALFTTADAQWVFDGESGLLRYLNADLRIMPELASRLGDERYSTVTVGVLDLDLTLRVGSMPAAPDLVAGGTPPPCGDWSGTNLDVALTNMSNIGQAGISVVNGRSVVVVLPSADLRNVGDTNVPWFSKFTNLGVPPWNDQHPFLVWQMLRSREGVLEPLGKSDLKHAFLTLNTGCDPGACTDSHILGLGCSDVYGTSTNNSVGSLAPRAEVSALSGIWSHCGGIPSHFDTNGDCAQDFSGAGENAFTHGLKAAEADMQAQPAGTTYYVEAFYIIRGDTNIFNSMGYRQVAPAKPASTWTFPTVGAYAQGPAINAWVNPTTPGADADNRVLDTGQGKLQLAVRVTDVAGSPGRKRFAYALQNHDFDRRISSFRVPFTTAGLTIDNAVHADGDGFTANNWTSSIDAAGITWTAPAATTPPAEIDYATLVSFRFDVDAAPSAAPADLGAFEAGSPSLFQIQTLAPAGATPVPQGSFYAVNPCRLLDTRDTVGPSGGPALVAGAERSFPVRGVCGVPATASAVALNITAVEPAHDGHVVVYPSALPGTSSLNYVAGPTRAGNTVIGIGADGSLRVTAVQATGVLDFAVDVSGYFE